MHGSGAVSCSCSLLIRGPILPAVRQKLHLSPCADEAGSLRSMIGSDREAPGAARRAEGGEVALLRDGAVKRIALAGDAAERANEALHFCWGHLLSVTRTGRTGDGLVHQRAAEIVGAAAQTCLHALAAHLHPGGLDVGDQRM